MGILKYINKRLKLKTQFIIYFILTIIIFSVISLIVLSSFLFIFHNKKAAYDNERYVQRNSNVILNISFKNELDEKIANKDFDYWVVSKENKVLYSSGAELPSKEIHIKSTRYSLKIFDKINKTNYIVTFTPIIIDNKLVGGFIQKYTSNPLAEINIIDKLIQRIGINTFYFIFFIFIVVIIIPVTVLVIFSKLFSHEINNNLRGLIDISNSIKNGNLDFTIDLSYKNEIGDVLAAFNEMKSALEKSLKTQWLMTEQRKEMILAITHDLKTPITIICGHLELLSTNYKNISSEQKESYINIMLNNSNKIRIQINQLNEVWDLERPNFVLNIQPVNLSDFFSSVKENLSYLCTEKEVNLKLLYPLNDKTNYHFDSFRIDEVISNIISNSLKYTKKDDSIILECFIENSLIIFKISDTGKGFSEETDIIFNKYYKSNEDIAYKSSSGLGLYICKLIVEKHKGKIRAYNNNEGGATVEFCLPIC